MRMSAAEQADYCELHYSMFREDMSKKGQTSEGKGRQNTPCVKSLLCGSVAPRFRLFHGRLGSASTKSDRIGKLMEGPYAGVEKFLRYSHDESDYLYHVPRTRLGRALELLSLSPILRYVAKLIYELVIQQKKRFAIFAHTPAVAWLVLMFCQNWGVNTAWLRAGSSQSERDRILADFNNPNGTLQVFISTHEVGGFGINLHLSGCHHMLIVEPPRNLNTLLQTQARLARIGQHSRVYIWQLFVDHTFQRWWSANLANKAISDISAQLSDLDDDILDSTTIAERAESALNIIMGWGDESRSHWSDAKELHLSRSLLKKWDFDRFAETAGAGASTRRAKRRQTEETPASTKRTRFNANNVSSEKENIPPPAYRHHS